MGKFDKYKGGNSGRAKAIIEKTERDIVAKNLRNKLGREPNEAEITALLEEDRELNEKSIRRRNPADFMTDSKGDTEDIR